MYNESLSPDSPWTSLSVFAAFSTISRLSTNVRFDISNFFMTSIKKQKFAKIYLMIALS